MKEIKIRVVTQNQVSQIFKNNNDFILNIVEDALRKWANDDAKLPDKISQIFDQNTQNRINCMPATIIPDKVSGMKWVSVFPANAPKGVQNVSGILLLSEIETGFPVAVIDGTLETRVRTAAVGTVAAKYLAPKNPRTIGFLGSGEEARMHFALLKHTFPTIEKCYVASRKSASEESFISELKEAAKDVEFIACNADYSLAASSADIIVTAISGQVPLLKAKDVKPGTLYIHVGGWEDEYAVALKANKIICDDWNASKHRTQTISRMYMEGILKDEDIYADLAEIITGKKLGREKDDEFIYFNSVGLSFIDLNFANEIYKQACKLGLGQEVMLTETDAISYKNFI